MICLKDEGYITKKSMLFVADGNSDYIVAYWFKLPNGERVEVHRGVSKKLWNSLNEGGTLVLLYDARNPNRNFRLGAGYKSNNLPAAGKPTDPFVKGALIAVRSVEVGAVIAIT